MIVKTLMPADRQLSNWSYNSVNIKSILIYHDFSTGSLAIKYHDKDVNAQNRQEYYPHLLVAQRTPM